jgi:hypothetical protein
MNMSELLPLLSRLKRGEKLHIVQYLVSELVQEESNFLTDGMSYPVWSPYDAFDAANTMLKVLATETSNDV